MTDNNTCPASKTTAATHCWHLTNQTYTTNPPILIEKCCNCGQTRQLRQWHPAPLPGHGPYL